MTDHILVSFDDTRILIGADGAAQQYITAVKGSTSENRGVFNRQIMADSGAVMFQTDKRVFTLKEFSDYYSEMQRARAEDKAKPTKERKSGLLHTMRGLMLPRSRDAHRFLLAHEV